MTLEKALAVVAFYQHWGRDNWMSPDDEKIYAMAQEVIEREARVAIAWEMASLHAAKEKAA